MSVIWSFMEDTMNGKKTAVPIRLDPETAEAFRKFAQDRGVTQDRALRMLLAIWEPSVKGAQ
jgi:hypothetical protein